MGGTNIDDPLDILEDFNPKFAKPGQTLLMISTTGDQFAFYKLNNELQPIQYEIPKKLIAPITRITENCEPALCSVLFVGGQAAH